MGMQIDGLLIVDKPGGITSLDVVREVKRRLGVKKAGHLGTLDPFATGVLPVVINEGTKLVPFLIEEPKDYEAVLALGEETTTDDPTGEVTSRRPWAEIPPEGIRRVFQAFSGKIRQRPPMYSAIKVNGRPLYHFARKGIEVDREEREVQIFSIEAEEVSLPHIRFKVSCSKGTYIRTLAREIGRKIGCGAHLLCLRRTRSGFFNLERAIPWDRLKSVVKPVDLVPWFISLEEALPSLPEVIGDEQLTRKVRFGKELVIRDLSPHSLSVIEKGQWLKMSSPEEGLVAILRSEVKGSDLRWSNPAIVALRPLRVFQPNKRLGEVDHP